MANFTAKDVQELRELTGVGMMDCKKALTEADGDKNKAQELLREKGLAKSESKAGRVAAEGIVHAIVQDGVGVVLEVNSETDFVGKNADFVSFVDAIAKTVASTNPADVDVLLETKLHNSDMSVGEELKNKIFVIGENLKIRRFERYEGVLSTYVHSGGRIGVMVQFETEKQVAEKPEFQEFAKDIAMQIAAVNPQYLDRTEVPSDIVDKEREILVAQVKQDTSMSGKPDAVIDKIVNGRLGKFYGEVCLLDQSYVKDGNITVDTYIKNSEKTLGGNIKILRYARFEKGEGLEKKEDNFADEVAGMMK